MSAMEMLQSAQFVVGRDGRPLAVQISFEAWEALLDWLTELEDRALVKEMIEKLRQGPQKAKPLRWDDVASEWDEETEVKP